MSTIHLLKQVGKAVNWQGLFVRYSRSLKYVSGIASLLLSFITYMPASAQDLTFSYSHYPPYTYIERGQPKGIFIDNIIEITKKAKIPIEWEYIDMNGVVNILDDGRRLMCEVGRTYTPDRASRWQYSQYLLTTIPGDVVVTRPENLEKITKHKTIQNLVNDKSLYGILAKGQLYSVPVEQALKNKVPWIGSISYSDAHSSALVQRGRADYSISELTQLQEAKKINPILKSLVFVHLEGQMDFANLYTVCTKATPAMIIDKINAAMKELNYKIGPEFQ